MTMFAKLDIRRDDCGPVKLPAKAEELLCYLLLHRHQAYTREALACELWADTPATQAKKYLRQCLWQLQHVLDEATARPVPLLHLDHEWVAMHPDSALQVDALQFEHAFMSIRDRPGAALNQQLADTAQQAALLYGGPLLSGWYQNWCLVERERYESIFVAMLDKLIDYCRTHGQFDQGIAYGMRLLRADYTHERTHRQIMRLYYLAGDRSMALRQFDMCAAALHKEYGIQPTDETLTLFKQIRADQLDAEPEQRHKHVLRTESDVLTNLLAEIAQMRRSVTQLQHDIDQIKQTLQTPS
jgi:DNA-binding SARP family transcriptional activator